MLSVADIDKCFGSELVLKGITLDFPAHRTTALIGPSGCGKTTLLRVLLGLVVPDRGNVTVGDERLSLENKRRLRHRMGYVVQDGGLFPHLTARENATLLARHLGWSPGRQAQRMEELSELLQLHQDGLVDRYPAQMSGGQRQRVGLMRALFLDPEFVLLDEPLGALDPMTRSDLQRDLRNVFHRLKKTVVLVTHDMHEASILGDEIAFMRDGDLIQIGSFDSLRTQPKDPYITEFMRAQYLDQAELRK